MGPVICENVQVFLRMMNGVKEPESADPVPDKMIKPLKQLT
jgi:hypothetical protein